MAHQEVIDPPMDVGIADRSKSGFESLGVSPEVAQVLASQGITSPFPIQEMAIPDGMAGRDVCGKARTGQGKTLAFGLPLVHRCTQGRSRRPRALVLAPTRELAQQVGDVLAPLASVRDLSVATYYGGTPIKPQIAELRRGVDILVGTPGRLIDLTERNSLDLGDIKIIVVDEADRMCDMGFMPQVEWLFRRIKSRDQTMLYSATLDGQVDMLVKIYLRDPVFHDVVDDDNTIEEMTHLFFEVTRYDKSRVAATIARGARKSIMFTRTKRNADALAKKLQSDGIEAAAIHGDRPQSTRERVLERFSSGKVPVLVATNVAARGLDIEGVDVVVHYDPPQNPKDYVHRSGRTARAGEEGVVVTIALPQQRFDVWLLQREIGMQDEDPIRVHSSDERLMDLSNWSHPAG